jgi:excisionase family DNA binding protein
MPNQHHVCDCARGDARGGEGRGADAASASLGDPLLTVDQVAAHLGVSRGWVYDSIRRGHLPAVRVGRYLRCSPAAVRALPAPVHDVFDTRS